MLFTSANIVTDCVASLPLVSFFLDQCVHTTVITLLVHPKLRSVGCQVFTVNVSNTIPLDLIHFIEWLLSASAYMRAYP